MSKTERGLPKSFDIHIPAGPVSLGDYLDEPKPQPPVQQQPPQPVPAPIVVQPPPQPKVHLHTPTNRSAPPRKQFNMSPATLNMLDELLTHIRSYSAERDIRASEVVHALVLAVHEVRPFLDLTKVPPRGKWGSPAAAALPVALKDAFQTAIARAHK